MASLWIINVLSFTDRLTGNVLFSHLLLRKNEKVSLERKFGCSQGRNVLWKDSFLLNIFISVFFSCLRLNTPVELLAEVSFVV